MEWGRACFFIEGFKEGIADYMYVQHNMQQHQHQQQHSMTYSTGVCIFGNLSRVILLGIGSTILTK